MLGYYLRCIIEIDALMNRLKISKLNSFETGPSNAIINMCWMNIIINMTNGWMNVLSSTFSFILNIHIGFE